MADETASSFFPNAKWEVDGQSLTFSAQKIREIYGNRLIPHKRIYRDGARLDNTGGDPIGWEITTIIHNGRDEPGLDPDPYPGEADVLCDMMQSPLTGTLTTPTRGPRRCKAEKYERNDDPTITTDGCAIVLTWMEDNEDDARAASFQAPNAQTVIRSQVELCVDLFEAQGLAGGSLIGSLQDAAAQLEGLMNAPGDFVADIEDTADSLCDIADQIGDTANDAGNQAVAETAALFTDPASSAPGRILERVKDTARRAVAQKVSPIGGRVIEKRYSFPTSIFDVAMLEKQDAGKLLVLNASLPSPLNIPAHTVVKVYG